MMMAWNCSSLQVARHAFGFSITDTMLTVAAGMGVANHAVADRQADSRAAGRQPSRFLGLSLILFEAISLFFSRFLQLQGC